MREAIVFEAERKGYGIDQIANSAMTVGELRDILDQYDDEVLVVLSHDNGYTFGSLNERLMADSYEAAEGEWDEPNFREW